MCHSWLLHFVNRRLPPFASDSSRTGFLARGQLPSIRRPAAHAAGFERPQCRVKLTLHEVRSEEELEDRSPRVTPESAADTTPIVTSNRYDPFGDRTMVAQLIGVFRVLSSRHRGGLRLWTCHAARVNRGAPACGRVNDLSYGRFESNGQCTRRPLFRTILRLA